MTTDRDTTIFQVMSQPQRTARFLSRLAPDGDCLMWTMAKNPKGYGVFRIGVNGASYTCSAHRVAWMIHHGEPVPPGLEVDHLCCRPSCCKPTHLEAVVRRENVARALGRSLADQAAVSRSGPASIHVRRRVRGDRFLVTWRDYLADDTVVQRGESFADRPSAEAYAATLLVDAVNGKGV